MNDAPGASRNAAAVVDICRRLDGNPLALQLAASRVGVLTPAQSAELLEDRFNLLTTGDPSGPARHRTLRAAASWSYSLLSDEERALFDRLAVFAGGFTLEAAAAIANGPRGPGGRRRRRREPSSGGGDGRRHSGVAERKIPHRGGRGRRRGSEGEVRYRCPETLRQYALMAMRETGRLDDSMLRCAGYYEAFTASAAAAMTGPDQPLWLDRPAREYDIIRAVLRWALDTGRFTAALRLAASLW